MRMFLAILTLAAAMTGLNALKPLHVDDATYYFNAAQIAAHPLDPYGHRLLYFSDPLPALHVLAPPLLPAWWAVAIRLFGQQPLAWKIWLFPIILLFVASLASLLRRFAPSRALPLLVLLTLSPVFLPGVNLMLDIPALALSLTALVLFLRACDRDSLPLAVFAGLVAGLAMQTKYTGFLAPAVMLVYAVSQRRIRLGFVAAAAATILFCSWEMFLVWRYGESHFRYHSGRAPFHFLEKLSLIGCLFPIVGAVDAPLLLLALMLQGVARRWLLAAAILVFLPYLLVFWADPIVVDFGYDYLPLTGIFFIVNGTAFLLALGWIGWRLARPAGERVAWFLVSWLVLELAGYVALSPFHAVRRIMGLTVAATILLGYYGEQINTQALPRTILYGLVTVTVFLGLGYFAVDCLEARTEQQAAYEAAQRIRQRDAEAVIWYVGYWGFQYYAEESGMRQVVPLINPDDPAGQVIPPTRFHRGDWIVVPDGRIPRQFIDLDPSVFDLQETFNRDDSVPVRVLIYYYAGWPPVRHRHEPCLEIRHEPRLEIRLYRVKEDCTARLPR